MSEPAIPRYSEKALLAVLAAVQFTHIMDFMIMMPLGPKFMRAFEISPTQFGLLVSSYSFSAGAMGLLAGFFMDRFDRKRSLTVLYSGFLLGTLACALAPGYVALMLARIIAGGFGGVAGSVVMAIVGDVIPPERRGRAMGVVMTAFSLASILGLPAGLTLAEHFGWHAPFFLLVALGACVWTSILIVLPALPPHHDHSPHGVWMRMGAILSHPNHVRAFVAISALTAAGSLIYPFMSPSMVSNGGLPEKLLPWIYLCGGAATIVSSPLFGRWADRYGKARIFVVLALISALPTLAVTHMPVLPVPVILALTTVFMIFASGRFVPMMALVTTSVEPRYRGGFMSVNSAVQQLSGGVATAVTSALVWTGPDGRLVGYGRAGVLSVTLLLAAVLLVRRVRPAAAASSL